MKHIAVPTTATNKTTGVSQIYIKMFYKLEKKNIFFYQYFLDDVNCLVNDLYRLRYVSYKATFLPTKM